MSVKGSWSRVRDAKAFGANYEGIFRRQKLNKESRKTGKRNRHGK